MKLHLRHARAVAQGKDSYCNNGIRYFCEVNGISYRDFVMDGIDIEIGRAMNDSMVNAMIEVAEQEARELEAEKNGR